LRSFALAVSLVLTWAAALGAETKLSITADVGICAHPKEVELNTGGSSRVRVKGNEHYYLFRFDTGPVRNWRITKAALHVKLAGGHLRRVAFCTVPVAPAMANWTEGTARNQPQKGSPCFTCVSYPGKRWTGWGGTMMDATFNNPRMLWVAANVKAGADGWLEIPIDPRLVMACALGLSNGLVMSDEKGQTRENHDIFTREQSSARPYVTVQGKALRVTTNPSRGPFVAEPFPPAAGFGHGAICVDTSTKVLSGGVVGSVVRIHPPIRPDQTPAWERKAVTLGDPEVIFEGLEPNRPHHVKVWTFHDSGAVADSMTKTVLSSPALELPMVARAKTAATMPAVFQKTSGGWRVELRQAGEVVLPDAKPLPDGATMPVPVTPRNAWVALQAVLLPPNGHDSNVTVAARAPTGARITPPGPVRLYRTWYVLDAKAVAHAEVLVPIKPGAAFDIPWKANKLPRQTRQPIFVDVWVPRGATPGRYAMELRVKQAGKDVIDVPIPFEVATATLGDEFRIVGDMNAYGSPAGAMGVRTRDPKAYMAMERKYYRLAHAHRMTLNVLPYSQSGSINWRGAPRTGADGKLDFAEWDERYGPLLSGEAFSPATGYVGPGANTPIHHMYLPFHENWPCKLAEHFKPWPPPKDYDAFLKWSADLPTIGQCFGGGDSAYAAWWHRALRDFQHHLAQRGWRHTRYQVYLNNKYYFRNPKESSGRGVSLWLLDEPMFADDFLALRHFGTLALSGGFQKARPFDPNEAMQRVRMVRGQPPKTAMFGFRIDISRPTHQRNWLDGLVDLNVCAGQLHSQRHLIARRKRRFAEEYWNYRMPPSFTSDNAAWALWPVQSYCWGATGTLPWQTIGSDGDLAKADETALMYPGRKFGLKEPVPSLRMKAWREGLQIAEMLRMLREKRGWNDIQLRAWVGQVLQLEGWKDGMDPKADAGIVTFKGVGWEKLEILKLAIVGALDHD